MEDCNVHTVLRCPRGTFATYTAGTKTNVIFFTKGRATTRVWVYDARTNVPMITKKSRPLNESHFADFERCYGDDPNGGSERRDADSHDCRWRGFSLEEVIDRGFKIDGFKWLRDEELDDPHVIVDPADLVIDAIAELRAAVTELHGLQKLLDDGGVTA
jgi:type I restriction enzyme M protein